MEDFQKTHRHRKNRESLLETLESIVVAFILAFVFRAFVVEAFVIPTGSMGPTLYGAHIELKCTDCGYEFAVGSEGVAEVPVCPNCFQGQRLPQRVPLFSGDRILVLKFIYDFQEPERWDVIVFRNPNDPSQNYIKRLVALPGETVELVLGDVTIDRRIVQKTDRAQDALWMLVHDTRYRPTRSDWKPRWIPEKPWQERQSGFAMERALPNDRTAWLTYRHRDPEGRLDNIADFYAYNTGAPGRRFGTSTVTDLGLRTEVTAALPTSAVAIEMRAWKDRFRFELTAEGSAQPSRILLNGKPVAQTAGGVLPVGRAVSVQAANVDHKLMLLVGGRRVMTMRSLESTPEGDVIYEPQPLTDDERRAFENPRSGEPQAMAAEVRVGANGGPVTLDYLRLDRDVYYLNDRKSGLDGGGPGWGTESNPFGLHENEFFVCGDNSPKSYDSRLWAGANARVPGFEDRPVVPRGNLAGKAFFVYWPAAGKRSGIPVAPDPMGFRLVH